MLSTVLCYTSFKYLTGEKEVVTMSPASKAQQRAVNKYMKKNYDRVNRHAEGAQGRHQGPRGKKRRKSQRFHQPRH